MNKVLVSLMAATFMITAPVFAQNNPPPADSSAPAAAPAPTPVAGTTHPHHEHHPEIHRAMLKLRHAKEDLEKAASDYDGHKAKAIEAIDHALEELHEALAYANTK